MSTKRTSRPKLPHWPESGFFDQSVAGVSYRTQELSCIADWHKTKEQIFVATATLVAEPENMHDPRAIKVLVRDCHVGYIPKEDVSSYRRLLLGDAESPQETPTSTASIRVTRMLFEDGEGYSAALDMSASRPPSTDDDMRPRVVAPKLMPRFYDSFSLKDGCLVVLSMEVNSYTAQRCYAGAELDVWMPKDSEDVYVYAPDSAFGQGKVFVTDMALLRKIGFKTLDEFEPIVHTACGSMVLTYAKLPSA